MRAAALAFALAVAVLGPACAAASPVRTERFLGTTSEKSRIRVSYVRTGAHRAAIHVRALVPGNCPVLGSGTPEPGEPGEISPVVAQMEQSLTARFRVRWPVPSHWSTVDRRHGTELTIDGSRTGRSLSGTLHARWRTDALNAPVCNSVGLMPWQATRRGR